MAAKMDKQELNEPDKLQMFFLRLREWAEKHRRRIYAGGGILLLLALIVGGWSFYRAQYQKSATGMYNRTIEAAAKASSPTAETEAIKGFKELIAKYPRSQAAVTAYYRLGNLYLDQREYDLAIGAYQEYLKNDADQSDLRTLAYNALGACHEAKKDLNKALESYELALKTPAAHSFEALNFGNIARIHEANKDAAKAVEYYKKALEKTTDPLMTLYLKRKLAMLG